MATAEPFKHDVYETKLELTIVMLCSMAGTLMQALDSTIANVALPYMQGSLAASRDEVTWVLTSYIVAAAIMTAPVGWLAGRFGRKNLALVSIGGFTVMSMLCGAAQTLDQMILFRLLQGAFGAALSPLSQAIMLDLYPPEKRGSAMAIWGMGVMVGPILGPTLGGFLTDAYDWRWVFYVNLPFGIAALLGLWFFYKDTIANAAMKFDWMGFAFLALALAGFQLMLDRGTDKNWFESGEIIVETVLGCVGAYMFVVQMLTSDRPFIPKELFKDRNFLISLLLMFTLSMLLMASSALLPPYLQNLGGYSVVETGLLMSPRGVGNLFAMMLAGRLATRFDSRYVMLAGSAMLLWAMWEMSTWTPAVSATQMIVTTLVQGFGIGLVFVPMSLVAFVTLAPALRTDASAVLNLLRNIGGAIGVSVTSTILTQGIQVEHARLAESASPFNRALSVNGPSMMWNPKLPFGLQQFNGIIEQNAQVIAYTHDFLFMLVAGIPALLSIFLMRKPRPLAAGEKLEVSE
jgi:DHA2 family multidrug resistance protein